MNWDDPTLDCGMAAQPNQQDDVVDVSVLEATETGSQAHGPHAPWGGSLGTSASGNVFDSSEGLQSNLKSFGVPIPKGMANIHGSLALGNQHFNQNPSRGGVGPSSGSATILLHRTVSSTF